MKHKDSIFDHFTKGKLFFALLACIGLVAILTKLLALIIIFCLIVLVYLVTGFKQDVGRWCSSIRRKIDINLYKYFK